jgi:hypothetical protein
MVGWPISIEVRVGWKSRQLLAGGLHHLRASFTRHSAEDAMTALA